MSATVDSLPVAWLRRIGAMTLFLGQVLARIIPAFGKPGLIVKQIYNAGARSLVIIMLSGLFVGMVLGLLGFDTLQRFGSEDSLGVLAALGMLKVLGPVLTALLFAGRAGTSLTSEIGLMKSTDQLTAMQMMAVDPLRYVVAPRFLGGIIAMPLLAATFSVIGLYGAQLIGVQQMGVDVGAFWSQTQNAVDLRDVTEGVVKSLVFGVACSLIAVYEGYNCEPTPEGVGLATTRTVVTSSVHGAAVELSADRRVPNKELIGMTTMKNSRSLEIGTGLFVLLGFAALAFLTTQLPGTSLKFGGGDGGYTRHGEVRQHRRPQAGLAGHHGGRARRTRRVDPLRPQGLQGGGRAAYRKSIHGDPRRQRRQHPDRGSARRQVRRHRSRRLGNLPQAGRSNRVHAVGHRARESGQQVLRQHGEQGTGRAEGRRAGAHRSRNDAVDAANRSGWVHRMLC